jgi:hypothetical protein
MFEEYYMSEDATADLNALNSATDVYNAISKRIQGYLGQPTVYFDGEPVIDVRVKYGANAESPLIATHSDSNKPRAFYVPQTKTISIYVPDFFKNIGKQSPIAKKTANGVAEKTLEYLKDWIKSKDAKQLMVHEIIHNMDFDRFDSKEKVLSRRQKDKSLPTHEKTAKYYNSPEEFNAFFTQFLKKLQNELSIKDLSHYKDPNKVLQDYANKILPKFNSLYRKKFIKRFSSFWGLVAYGDVDFLQ